MFNVEERQLDRERQDSNGKAVGPVLRADGDGHESCLTTSRHQFATQIR
jgi:hypothetical protein